MLSTFTNIDAVQRILRISVLIFCLEGILTLSGWAAGRVALVIGNARYEPTVGKLRNTGNDAKSVALTLRKLGFVVTEKHDVNRDQMLRLVDEFRKSLPGAEIALFYYAGHGISIAGANYLIPLKSGFEPAGAEDITLRMLAETRLFNAEQIVAEMSASGAHCNLIILDACRNTPLTKNNRSRSLPGASGLAEMTPPAGSLIAFATDAGRTAFDGDGNNGLYTEELLKNMRSPGLTIEQVFKRTRAAVVTRSDGGQVPAEYSRLIGEDIYLAGQAIASAPVTSPPIADVAKIEPPSIKTLLALAKEGKTKECLLGLEAVADKEGPGEFALLPMEFLLENVKLDLKNSDELSTKIIAAAETCSSVLRLLPKCLPKDHPQANILAAKAYNRRGDALLLLGRAKEAIAEFDAALPLAPNDSYILYNRGRAKVAMGDIETAKADFTLASSSQFDQPGAKKLALQALAEIADPAQAKP